MGKSSKLANYQSTATAVWRHRVFGRAFVSVAAVLLSACVVLPQTREVYDTECQVLRRHITLEVAQLQGFHGCYGDACAVMLVAASAVTLASLVVSGSIAVVGNAVYWAERPGNCRRPVEPAAQTKPL